MKEKLLNDVEIYTDSLNIGKIIEKSNLDSIEEALHICDLSDIIKKYYLWKKHMPRVTPFYAVKCNDHPYILKTLAYLGTGFDCASKAEIAKILSLGVSQNRIIFANPTKPISHLTYAANKNVTLMTFDSDFELHKIRTYYPSAELVIRIRCDAEKALCPLGEKYGCEPFKEAPKLIGLAKSLGLKIIGVSFHVGSGCMEFQVYKRALAASRTLFDYAETVGYKFDVLDIGGGFPGDKGTTLNEVSIIVNAALDEYFPETDIKIISEPGRFFAASAFTLVCRIHSKREIIKSDRLESIMYYINDGVYGSFNSILYDHHIASPLFIADCSDKRYKSSVWGPTCDALDQICTNVALPQLDIGDYLVFENMGAYTIPIASPFNGFPVPRIQFYLSDKDEYINNILKFNCIA